MKSGCSSNDIDKLLWMLFVIVFDMLEAITNAFVMGEYHKVVAMPILNIPIGKTNHHFIKTLYKHKVYECKSIIVFYIFLENKISLNIED
jgi:cell division protein YceG involved in septum cleavage